MGLCPLSDRDLKLVNDSNMVMSILNTSLSSRFRVYILPFYLFTSAILLFCTYLIAHCVQFLVNLLLNISILVFVSTYSFIFYVYATGLPFSHKILRFKYCNFEMSSSGFSSLLLQSERIMRLGGNSKAPTSIRSILSS